MNVVEIIFSPTGGTEKVTHIIGGHCKQMRISGHCYSGRAG